MLAFANSINFSFAVSFRFFVYLNLNYCITPSPCTRTVPFIDTRPLPFKPGSAGGLWYPDGSCRSHCHSAVGHYSFAAQNSCRKRNRNVCIHIHFLVVQIRLLSPTFYFQQEISGYSHPLNPDFLYPFSSTVLPESIHCRNCYFQRLNLNHLSSFR